MCELINNGDAGFARHNRVDVHLLESHSAILDPLARNYFQVPNLSFRLRPLVCFDESDNQINAAFTKVVSFLKHAIALADTGCGANVDLELPSLARLKKLNELRFGSQKVTASEVTRR